MGPIQNETHLAYIIAQVRREREKERGKERERERERKRERERGKERGREERKAPHAPQVVAALDYVHGKGVLHGDCKPQNVLVNDHMVCRLTDFGECAFGQACDMRGTPLFMAPEQLCQQPYHCKVDVWALGISALFLAEGK